MQLQGYMHLTGRKKARLIYILTNTPENLVEKEIFYKTKDIDGISQKQYEEIENRIRNYHDYSDIEPKNKVKKILYTIPIFLLTLHIFSNGLSLEKKYERVDANF